MDRLLAISVFLILLVGCGTELRITSTPSGAAIDLECDNFRGQAIPIATPHSIRIANNYKTMSVKWRDGTKSDCKSTTGYLDSGAIHFIKPTVDHFTSYPQGAKIFCKKHEGKEDFVGVTPTNKKHSKGDGSIYSECRAEKVGFAEEQKRLDTSSTIDRHINFELKKEVETIYETVTSIPQGADIYWGEERSKLVFSGFKTPYKKAVKEIYPKVVGKYYQVKLNGYLESNVEYYPESIDSRSVDFNLTKDDPANIKISSNQDAVKIYLNDKYIGDSSNKPLHKSIKRGTYSIKAIKDKYESQEYTFTAEAGQDYIKHFDLTKIVYGAVKFTSNMSNVDIYINGELKGRIGKNPFVAKLPIGTHTVMAKKDLFGAKTINVKIEAYDSFAYNFELKEAGNLAEQMGTGKIVQSTGELVLFTGRNDLSVTIMGTKYTPPATIPNMASGRYKARLSGVGVLKDIDITVKEGGRSVIDLDELL